jgi:hypothetical protein
LGSDEGVDEIRNMTTGTYSNPIAQPSTVYLVYKRPPFGAGDLMLPVDIAVNYVDSFLYQGAGGGNLQTWAMGENNISVANYNEKTYAACFKFDTATSAAYLNNHFVVTDPGYADGSTNAENDAAMGSHPSGDGRYKWAARIIVSGADDASTRRTMMKWMDNRYQLGRTLRSLGPQLLVEVGDYVGSTPGTWTERRGHNMLGTGGDGPPIDVGGFPDFVGGVDFPLGTTGWTLNDWAGSGDHHIFCTFNPDVITGTATSGVSVNESPFDDAGAGYLGFFLRVTGGIYYCDYMEFDAAECFATVELGASLGSAFVIQGKKEGGFLWIRLGTDPWIQGGACGATGSTAAEAYCGRAQYDGKVYAIASWKRVLTADESDRLAAYGKSLTLP